MDDLGSYSMLPNKSLTQNDLAAWVRLPGIKKAPPERGLLALSPASRASLPFLLRLPLPRQPLRLSDMCFRHMFS